LVVCFTLDTYVLVGVLSMLIYFDVPFWICLVTFNMLHDALIAVDMMVWMFFFISIILLPEFLLSFIFDNTIGCWWTLLV
jgi:hypothetical protein